MHQNVELNIFIVIKRRSQAIEICIMYGDTAKSIKMVVLGHTVQP